MKFLEFNSLKLVNTVHDRVVREIKESTMCLGQWIATEKLHGANVGVYSDGNEVKVAKRTDFITEDDKFYGLQEYIRGYESDFIKFAKFLHSWLEELGDLEVLKPYSIVYGEYFGGGIHKGTPYPFEKEFRAFDFVTVVNEVEGLKDLLNQLGYIWTISDKLEGKIIILPMDKLWMFSRFVAMTSLDHVRVIASGNFDEIIQLNPNEPTAFSCEKRVEASGIRGEKALAYFLTREGLVIEPNRPIVEQKQRIVLKLKSEKFKEKDKVDAFVVPLSERNRLALDEVEHDLISEWSQMITPARYSAVVSKIGEVTIKDFNTVLSAFMKDMQKDGEEFLVEVAEEDENRFNGKTKLKDFEHSKEVMMLLIETVKSFIRPLLLNK